jgi:hypothetical protein
MSSNFIDVDADETVAEAGMFRHGRIHSYIVLHPIEVLHEAFS